MTEKELIKKVYDVLSESNIEGVDNVTFSEKEGVRVEFYDGPTPKRLSFSDRNIGLDYGGHFLNKGYKTNPMP